MNSKLICTFLLFSILGFAKADVGDPTLQAVCKITMKNGKTVEGFITVGLGGINGIWMNGFNVKVNGEEVFNRQVFFDLGFRFFGVNDSSIYHTYQFEYAKGHKTIKFLQWVDHMSIHNPTKTLVDKDSLIIIKHIERHYLLKDTLIIYTDLPLNTYLDTIDFWQTPNKKINTIEVAVNDIIKFELVEKPDSNWLHKITLAKNEWEARLLVDTGTGDYQPAGWFHEFIANKELYDYYNPGLVHNLEMY